MAQIDAIDGTGDVGARPAEPVVKTAGRNLTCAVCTKPLFVGDRKVHRGACAHTRELQLQRMRRRLRR